MDFGKYNNILETEIGYFPEATGFRISEREGYSLLEKLAFLDCENPNKSLFRNFFGKGVFCEWSLIGKTACAIAQDTRELNKYLVKTGEGTLPIIPFNNLQKMGGFAMWVENLLTAKAGFKNRERFSDAEKFVLNYLTDVENKYGRDVFLWELGFPKNHDNHEKVLGALRSLGYEIKADDIVMVYGSGKPYSDIDIFMVSGEESEKGYFRDFTGSLDIYQITHNKLDDFIELLEYGTIDPIFSGNLIHGSRQKLESLKNRILDQPITTEAIKFHLKTAQERIEDLRDNPTDNQKYDELRDNSLKYCITHANELKKGIKNLTCDSLKKLFDKYKEHFPV